jgi:hypothetical protein
MPEYPLWKPDALAAPLGYGFRMRTAPALLLATLIALSLTSCVPDAEPITPSPEPSASPIFASDEEALAAAEAAYAAYLEVSAAILSQGGADPERLLLVATTDIYKSESDSFKEFADSGWRSEGTSFVDTVSLQFVDNFADEGQTAVSVYACLDVSTTDVFDSSGASIVSDGRPNRTPFETAFSYSSDSPTFLILSEKTVWSGENFCD